MSSALNSRKYDGSTTALRFCQATILVEVGAADEDQIHQPRGRARQLPGMVSVTIVGKNHVKRRSGTLSHKAAVGQWVEP